MYVTDILRMIAESTAKFSGGPYIKQRFYDIVKPKPKEETNKTGTQIADDIISKLTRR